MALIMRPVFPCKQIHKRGLKAINLVYRYADGGFVFRSGAQHFLEVWLLRMEQWKAYIHRLGKNYFVATRMHN